MAAILIAAVLALLGILIRIVNFLIRDFERAGGVTGWQKERYAAVPERETARTTAVRAEEDRRMIELDAKQQRREHADVLLIENTTRPLEGRPKKGRGKGPAVR